MNKLLYLKLFIILAATLIGCNSQFNIRKNPKSSFSSTNVDTITPCIPSALPFGYGDGSSLNPYLICSVAQLLNVAGNLGKDFKLMKDLDLTASGFTPIGADDTVGYSGIFNGNNKTISNWTYSSPADPFAVSLFRRLEATGIVKNLNLSNFTITGNNLVSGLVGYSYGNINQISVSNSTLTGNATVAGVVAETGGAAVIDNAIVSNITVFSSNTGTRNHLVNPATGTDTAAGGIVGGHGSGGDITNCAALNVTITYDPAGPGNENNWSYAAGIAGFMWGGSVTNSVSSGTITGVFEVGGLVGCFAGSTISNSYSTAVVTGNTSVGGLIGWHAAGTLSTSYSTGNIFGTAGGSGIGGIVGTLTATLSQSYSTGNISAPYRLGGIVGDFASGNVDNCYSTGNVTGETGDIGGAFGLLWGGTVLTSYSIAASVTSSGAGTPYAFEGRNAWAPKPSESYVYNNGVALFDSGWTGPLPNDATPLSAVEVLSQPSFAGFNFASVWKMPILNPGRLRTPVLAWECGVNGITCF